MTNTDRATFTTDQLAYFVLDKTISELPDEVKTPIFECRERITELVKSYGDAGLMAIALVGMKLQAEIDK
jgi:hypothetical protein